MPSSMALLRQNPGPPPLTKACETWNPSSPDPNFVAAIGPFTAAAKPKPHQLTTATDSMPHTQRRHRREQRREAAQNGHASETSDDGWTYIQPRQRPRTRDRPSAAVAASISTATTNHYDERTGTTMYRVLERLTVPQLDLYRSHFMAGHPEGLDQQPRPPQCQPHELRDRLTEFRESTAFESLRRSVHAVISASGLMQESPATGRITKGVCLGLGSPSGLPNHFFGLESSLSQVAVFLEFASHFETLANSEVAREGRDPDSGNRQLTLDLIVQDPVFNATDKTFLEDYCGMRVLDSPAAFDEIDQHSFVFAPHYPVYIWSASMRNSRCPLLVVNNADDTVDNMFNPDHLRSIFQKIMPEEDSIDDKIPDLHAKDELQRFLDTHESLAVPNEGISTYRVMNDMKAYWRKDDSD